MAIKNLSYHTYATAILIYLPFVIITAAYMPLVFYLCRNFFTLAIATISMHHIYNRLSSFEPAIKSFNIPLYYHVSTMTCGVINISPPPAILFAHIGVTAFLVHHNTTLIKSIPSQKNRISSLVLYNTLTLLTITIPSLTKLVLISGISITENPISMILPETFCWATLSYATGQNPNNIIDISPHTLYQIHHWCFITINIFIEKMHSKLGSFLNVENHLNLKLCFHVYNSITHSIAHMIYFILQSQLILALSSWSLAWTYKFIKEALNLYMYISAWLIVYKNAGFVGFLSSFTNVLEEHEPQLYAHLISSTETVEKIFTDSLLLTRAFLSPSELQVLATTIIVKFSENGSTVPEKVVDSILSNNDIDAELLTSIYPHIKTNEQILQARKIAVASPYETLAYITSTVGIKHQAYVHVFKNSFINARNKVRCAAYYCYLKYPTKLPIEIWDKILHFCYALPLGSIQSAKVLATPKSIRFMEQLSTKSTLEQSKIYHSLLT